jgi:hypothetical protein
MVLMKKIDTEKKIVKNLVGKKMVGKKMVGKKVDHLLNLWNESYFGIRDQDCDGLGDGF